MALGAIIVLVLVTEDLCATELETVVLLLITFMALVTGSLFVTFAEDETLTGFFISVLALVIIVELSDIVVTGALLIRVTGAAGDTEGAFVKVVLVVDTDVTPVVVPTEVLLMTFVTRAEVTAGFLASGIKGCELVTLLTEVLGADIALGEAIVVIGMLLVIWAGVTMVAGLTSVLDDGIVAEVVTEGLLISWVTFVFVVTAVVVVATPAVVTGADVTEGREGLLTSWVTFVLAVTAGMGVTTPAVVTGADVTVGTEGLLTSWVTFVFVVTAGVVVATLAVVTGTDVTEGREGLLTSCVTLVFVVTAGVVVATPAVTEGLFATGVDVTEGLLTSWVTFVFVVTAGEWELQYQLL